MASSSAASITRETFDEHDNRLQTAAVKALKAAAGALPADIEFHRTLDSDYATALDATAARVLRLTNGLLGLAESSRTGKGKGRLRDKEDVLDRFHAVVVDAMDGMLEQTDAALDDFLGKNKAPAIAVNPLVQKAPQRAPQKGRLDPSLLHASHLRKPQLNFKQPPNNYAEGPWRSTLKHKYNAQVPLGYIIDAEDEESPHDLLHPYRFEITNIQYPSHMFENPTPVPPESFEHTPFTWVATMDDFNSMLQELREAQEIAVDLEHHDYRTYIGFVCLMQVSTRHKDWIVDTLVLREELEELNEVFTDPRIVKILHGAESDIIWLQRDFNLYIVNLFDTYHASKVLDFPRHGLAQLLEMYCDVLPDKRYQTADWRIRPLPAEMLKYARMDTHYLLFIYDHLRGALLDRAKSPTLDGVEVSPFREVLARSAATAKRTHVREPYDAGGGGVGGWDALARKWNKAHLLAGAVHVPGSRCAAQKGVLGAVHAWRDKVAREEDESTRFVLPNHYLLQLAEQPPADMAALMRVFHPVPPVVRVRAKEIMDVIREAVREALGPQLPGAPVEAKEVSEPLIQVELAPEPMQVDSTAPSLWKAESYRATSSMLNGGASDVTTPRFTAPQSALLGSVLVPRRKANIAKPTFDIVLAKIHGSLSIAPSIPKPPASTEPPPAVAAQEPAVDENGQVEIPFVPAEQRQKTNIEMNDGIVVVGQHQKKRKRDRAAKQAEDAAPTPSASTPEVEVEAFDYASAPNILDEGAELLEDGSGKKRKLGKREGRGGLFQYGDFPAPPRNPTEIRSGNRSYTYR